MESTILVIGEALIDVVWRAGEDARRYPGGSPLNVAVGLGRLGHVPRLATWFGDDEDGILIARHCAASHVALLPGCDQAAHTSTAEATIDASGQASYHFDVNFRMPAIPAGTRPALVHTGSIGALLRPGHADVLAYVESAHSEAIVTFDPNCRPSLMGEAAATRELTQRYVAASDLVKVSDEDLAWLYPGTSSEDDLVQRARLWISAGPSVVIVTMGALGALAVTADSLLRVPADTRHGLVDTVGAGDSFMAGLIHGMVNHGYCQPDRRGALGDSAEDLTAILSQAAAIAGITVSRAGANPPWPDEL
ncbi:MAG: carbohydrate kinase [Propionibacteriaceae bacterium]|jgi:fructokinase|nr:carbohydrate kinase [Propionibacteriaceae bacterium]